MKTAPFKMKGFGGFGNSPAKQTLDKLDKPKENPLTESEKRGQSNYNSNTKKIPVTGSKGTRNSTKFAPKTSKRKDNLRAISGFEFDFPKITKNAKTIKNQFNKIDKKRVIESVASGGLSEAVRGVSKIGKKVKNYFTAR